jgi:hypothetical protein
MSILHPCERLKQNPNSKTAAINAKCFDCIYDPAEGGLGTWRRQIAACQIKTCALWNFRAKSSSARVNQNEPNE